MAVAAGPCKPKSSDIIPADIQPMGPWAHHYLGAEAANAFCRAKSCSGGSFYSTRSNLHARPLATYKVRPPPSEAIRPPHNLHPHLRPRFSARPLHD